MLFSSIPFLYYFLPLTLLCYFLAPRRAKNAVLLLFSLVFYAWGEPKYVLFMVASILQGYLFGRLVEKYRNYPRRSKLFLTVSVLFSLLLLGYCKYADFFIRSFNAVTGLSVPLLRVALPIGISFYTFQILSYVVDVYRGTVAAQRNLIDLGTYIAMFPQLIAGPIVRYADIEPQLKELYQLITVYKSTTQPSVLYSWMYAAAYMLHIYFDFSGYSDMAIGLGKIFGFHFAENFNYPYISRSATEFWRRWHMSLGSWFRDYVYIPMGGNRVAPARRYFNILVVWILTGLWHGADWNFVLWGLFFAVFLIMEKGFLLKPLQKLPVLSHLYTLLLVAVSFVIFDSAGLSEAATHLGRMFGAGGIPLVTGEALYYLGSYAVTFVIAIIGATPFPTRMAKQFSEGKGGRALSILAPAALVLVLAVVTAYLVDGSFNPFLYFRF